MPLLKIDKLVAGLSRGWSGYLRDWDRTLRAGNYPETPGSRRESHPPAPTDPDVNTLGSSGSCRPVVRSCTAAPSARTGRGPFPDPCSHALPVCLAAFQPLVLPPRPAHEMAIHALANRDHRARVEHGEVVQPAPQGRVHVLCEVIQCRGGASMQPPGRALRLISVSFPGATAGRKPVKDLLPLLSKAFRGRNSIPAERERHLRQSPGVAGCPCSRRSASCPGASATRSRQADDRSRLAPAGLTLGHAVDHNIVREAFEPDRRVLPDHPQCRSRNAERCWRSTGRSDPLAGFPSPAGPGSRRASASALSASAPHTAGPISESV